MSEQPFFSVVIPLYNKAPHVARSVGSVLNQTFQDFELIVVNDASTDGSVEEVQKFNNPRIRLLQRDKPGPGGYAARNLGIWEARAEWVAFLDADDEWYPNHLSSAYRMLNKYPDCTLFIFSCSSYLNKSQALKKIFCCYEKKMIRSDAIKRYVENDIHTNSVVTQRLSLIEAGMFPAGKCRRGGDSDLWLRLMLNSTFIAVSPEITSCYHIENSGVLADLNATDTMHPVLNTIKYSLEQNLSDPERSSLKKLGNRKSFSWSLSRKRAGFFKVCELRNFYFSAFFAKDWLRFIILLLPKVIYRSLRPNPGKPEKCLK